MRNFWDVSQKQGFFSTSGKFPFHLCLARLALHFVTWAVSSSVAELAAVHVMLHGTLTCCHIKFDRRADPAPSETTSASTHSATIQREPVNLNTFLHADKHKEIIPDGRDLTGWLNGRWQEETRRLRMRFPGGALIEWGWNMKVFNDLSETFWKLEQTWGPQQSHQWKEMSWNHDLKKGFKTFLFFCVEKTPILSCYRSYNSSKTEYGLSVVLQL